MIQHSIDLTKTAKKHLNAGKITQQIDRIIDRVLASKRRSRGWKCEIINEDKYQTPFHRGSEKVYTTKLRVICEKQLKDNVLKHDWDNVVRVASTTAASQAGGNWEVSHIDGKIVDPAADDRLTDKTIGYVAVNIPDKWQPHFEHIYERDSQIEIIMSAIRAGIHTNFMNRFHCALIGAPACGKTDTLRGLKEALGEDSVLEYDATATTQAGAIKDLDEREELPRILIVEEIEKTDENSLRWLLSVMDHRAEIRKVNFRTNIQKETRMLTLATVNNYKLFKKLMSGALASRFVHHVWFPKPDRKVLQKILLREIAKANGKKAWIKPALDFAEDQNIYDPRKVTAICLCGADDLLRGTYQDKLLATSGKAYIEEAEAAEE